MNWMMVLQFLVMTAIVVGPIIFFLHRMLVVSTEGAVRRLNEEAESTRKKQIELNQKLKEADEELANRQAEADALAKRMIHDAEEKAKEEREKLVQKARAEGEEIITKAQGTRDKIRKEIEKEMELKIINYSAIIVEGILSDKAKGLLDKQLVAEFIESLEKIDMTKVSADIDHADITSIAALDEATKEKMSKVLKIKFKREVKIDNKIDPQIIAGISVRFGSLGLDGSLRNSIQEAGAVLKQKVEDQSS